MVAGVLEPDVGSVRLGASLKIGYFSQQALDLLDPGLTVFEQMQHDHHGETQGVLRSCLGAFQFSGKDVDKLVRVLSGGEKSRLVMARMLLDPPNFLVLDEPTNHLDLDTKEMLVEALQRFQGTMLFVSHDRTFLKGLGSRVLELEYGAGGERRPHLYPGSYLEYVQKTGHKLISTSIAPGRPSPHSEPPTRTIADLRGRMQVALRSLVDRHRCETPPRRGKIVAVSARSSALGSTGQTSPLRSAVPSKGGRPCPIWGRSPTGHVQAERPASPRKGGRSPGRGPCPPGESTRAGDPVCVLRRRPPCEGTANRRLRYSGVPRVVALFTAGDDIVLRQHESQSPS
jgi:energy-coupling factor transporter ATP-binding protein EcfA2